MMPSADEKILLDQNLNEALTAVNSVSVDLQTSEDNKTTELSPKHTRYNSPLFQQLAQPITPVKMSRLSIPEDDSINKLLQATSLVSKTQKTPKIVETRDELTATNKTNEEQSEEAIDERLLKELSVPEKRPSLQDPEKVLMENVVPGEKKTRR